MYEKSELRPEFLGVHSINRLSPHNSGSRSTMFSSHIGQHLVIDGLEEPYIQTGVLQEFGKHTFSVKMPHDGRILKIIPRYPSGVGENSLPFNPETIVIYEAEVVNPKDPTGPRIREIDYFSLPYYASYHQHFGFRYKDTENINKIFPRANIKKGTIFKDSPGVAANSSYMFGTNLNVVFMPLPPTAEDGFVVRRGALEKLKYRTYHRRVVNIGSKVIPLNKYGNTKQYLPMPEIGSYIDETGELMVLREYDPETAPVDMGVMDLMEPDYIFDDIVYVKGGLKGRVVDIKVISNNNTRDVLPAAVRPQLEKYRIALYNFHKEIVETEKELRREHRKRFGTDDLRLSRKFHCLVVDSLALIDHPLPGTRNRQQLNLLYKQEPLDEYRIEFVIEYEVTPNLGDKLTDSHGGKGVICKILEDHEMPVDADGNVADVVLGSEAVVSRTNLGRLFEHYLNGIARDATLMVKETLSVKNGVLPETLDLMDPSAIELVWTNLMRLYKCVSTKQYEFFKDADRNTILQHISDITYDKVYFFMPFDEPKPMVQIIKELDEIFQPTYGPVTYVRQEDWGKPKDQQNYVTTERKFRIAPLYIMLLEKTPDEWSAISSGKLHLFGILSTPTRSERFRYPYRISPVRTISETEGRIYTLTGARTIAEMMERSNNPKTQAQIVWRILNEDTPTDIPQLLEDDHVYGQTKQLGLINHLFMCAGIEIKYEKGEL